MLKRIVLMGANIFERRFQENEMIAGRYKIIQLLGIGSYGNSYLVFDTLSKSKRVLKSLRVHQRLTNSGVRDFEIEKELLQGLNDCGFPKYFEDGVYKRIPFYTMEYIEGKNFEQLIFQEGKKYTEKEAFKLMEKLLNLIETLHSKRIIHRDIRIPNVMTNGTEVVLIDMGLARKVEEPANPIKKSKNLRKEVNFQADFYGLGHFLLFLLYSNFSVPGDQKQKSWEEELEISDKAKGIIRRLLQIEPGYDHCSQIKADIRKIIN